MDLTHSIQVKSQQSRCMCLEFPVVKVKIAMTYLIHCIQQFDAYSSVNNDFKYFIHYNVKNPWHDGSGEPTPIELVAM